MSDGPSRILSSGLRFAHRISRHPSATRGSARSLCKAAWRPATSYRCGWLVLLGPGGRQDALVYRFRDEKIVRTDYYNSKVQALEAAVTKPQRGEEPGGVLTLGSLLDELEGCMDESWRRYLAHLLVDPLGLNLRNDISHGLIPAVDQYNAALLIHAVSHLAILRLGGPGQPSEG